MIPITRKERRNSWKKTWKDGRFEGETEWKDVGIGVNRGKDLRLYKIAL